MSRYLMVSSDCHAAARTSDYRPYIEKRHLAAFEEWSARAQTGAREEFEPFFEEETLTQHYDGDAVRKGGEDGYWDFDRRITELEADGVVSEVIFPQPGNVPFDAFPSNGTQRDPELIRAGVRAYHRWLGDRVADRRERHVPIALVAIDDIDEAIQELTTAREAGFRGAMLPTFTGDWPLYNDERYEPLWAACAELGMPVHTHALVSANPKLGPGGGAITLHETLFFTGRPLWCMMLSGAFDRHPGLRFVVTEAGIEWIPNLLEQLDVAYTGSSVQAFTEHIHLKPLVTGLRPSEIWARQCWAGASFAPRVEVEMRHALGIDKLMWGSDYPHIEGSWPQTKEWIHSAFEGVPETEIRLMLGENAVDCYGLEDETLRKIADRVGPAPGEL